ncbi:MAG: hypothetical protein IJ752_02730 [Alphaproteobacteria bacterium]|nr:hypothetical protein [Alphaproteobacteria bacterium]
MQLISASQTVPDAWYPVLHDTPVHVVVELQEVQVPFATVMVEQLIAEQLDAPAAEV